MKWLKERSSGLMRRLPGSVPTVSLLSGKLAGLTAQERPVSIGHKDKPIL
jgi:hypothetical protein